MNTFKLAKNCKYLFPYLLSLIISLPVISQVAPASTGPATSAPSSAGSTQGNQPTGNQPGNQPGNANQTTQQGQGNNEAKTTTDKGKTAAAPNANDPKAANPGSDQSKVNNTTTATLTPAEQEKLEFRKRIYGSSIFLDKKFDAIPDIQISTPFNYIVGPGDQLNIYLYGYAEDEYTVLVSRDGFITIPRVGNVYVSGLSIEEVKKILIGKFSKFKPGMIGTGGQPALTKITVALGQIRNVTVFVSGEVVNPATYKVSSLSSAFNVLYQAGGPNEIGTFREVRVVRDGKVISRLDLYDFFANGKIDGDVRVQDNDNISVGFYQKRVEITGMVKRPGIYELKKDEKLNDVIRYAGGFDDKAYRARIKLQRITSKERRIMDVSEDQFDNFDMVTGDSINVETILDRFENIVTIEGAVMRPGNYSLENSGSLKKLIENAQGLREDAFVGRINVMRTRQDLTIQSIPLNYADILNNLVPDLILTRLDQVIIPSKFDMTEAALITVEGEVNNNKIGDNEGKFAYTADMTLEDALLHAGGLKESAYSSEVEVIRRKRNGVPGAANAQISEVFKFNVNRDLSLNGKATNFILFPYDKVIVRRSPNYVEQQSVFLEGEVLLPGEQSIVNKNDKISDIIKRAGGLTELAYPEGATLLRRTFVKSEDAPPSADDQIAIQTSIKKGRPIGNLPSIKEESVGIELKKILRTPGSSEDLVVQEGDIIKIPKRLETVQVTGEVLYPTTVKYGRGMSFSDYISQSGGFTMQSLRKSSYIKYPNGSVDRTRRFLVFNVYPKVEPGSEVFVPRRAVPVVNTQQAIQTASGLLGSVMGLVVTILAFRQFK